MTWESVWQWVLGPPLRVVLIILGALIAQAIAMVLIKRLINASLKRNRTQVNRRETFGQDGTANVDILLQQRHAQRATAVGSLLRSVATIAIWTIAVAMVLDALHVDIAPLLASAGIVGIAVGFGAQSLIKDYFSGIALILEDQFGVGDVVEISGVEGTVEEVTLRVTRVRDKDGVVWYLRNGEILRVANMSQGWSMASVTVPVDQSCDLAEVESVVNSMGDALFADDKRGAMLVTPPRYSGVDHVSGKGLVVRIKARTEPGLDEAGGRSILEAAVLAFRDAGIPLPDGDD